MCLYRNKISKNKQINSIEKIKWNGNFDSVFMNSNIKSALT